MNIRFSYLYRDAGNFKNFNEVIFSNPSNLPIEVLLEKVKLALLDEMYFEAFSVGIPELFFEDFDEELDHEWHEFENLTHSDLMTSDKQDRSIEDFILILETNRVV